MKKAIGYIRVSTTDQAVEGVSLDNQRAKIKAYADLKDLELIEIIEDAGISAKNLNRPGAQRVLEMAKRKQIDAVICYKLGRMFRSTVDALETTKDFDKWGVAFHSIQESLDTQSAMGRFFFTLTAALAEMERGIISERTSSALQHKRAKGEKTGGDVPFGYDSTDGRLTENQDEQSIIRIAHSLKERGYSLQRIANHLNSKEYKTKKGASWKPSQVQRILKRA